MRTHPPASHGRSVARRRVTLTCSPDSIESDDDTSSGCGGGLRARRESAVPTTQLGRPTTGKRRYARGHFEQAAWAPPSDYASLGGSSRVSTDDALKEALLARHAFFASASHDLKAPLTGIALWVDTLELLKPRLAGAAEP